MDEWEKYEAHHRKRLEKLYESLKRQSCKDFEWLVVDDGSTDGTDNLIGQLQEKSEFPVRYIYKSNGGKHTALNVGMRNGWLCPVSDGFARMIFPSSRLSAWMPSAGQTSFSS